MLVDGGVIIGLHAALRPGEPSRPQGASGLEGRAVAIVTYGHTRGR